MIACAKQAGVVALLCAAGAVFTADAAGGPDFAALRQQWADNLRDKRLDASVALYEDQAIFLNPDGTHVNGKAAIRSLYQLVSKSYDSDIALHSVRTDVSGALAYDSGTYDETLTPHDGSKSSLYHGTYLTVLHRDAKGHWRICQQMWAVQAQPQPAP